MELGMAIFGLLMAIRTMLYRLLLCDCEGPNSCEELIEARHFLFLGETE
jgi:hypothetical protein